MNAQLRGRCDAVELGLDAAARMHGISSAALRRRIHRKATLCGRVDRVEFDGHSFRKRDGRWRVLVRAPWIRDGRLRSWLSIEEAADRREIKPETLRRELQRHASKVRGLTVVRWRGLFACKFGDTWRVCVEDEGSSDV